MTDVKDMTLKEKIDEFSEMLLDYLPENDDDDRFEELYEKIREEVDDIDVDTKDFIAHVEFYPLDADEIYEADTNIISGDFFCWRYSSDFGPPAEAWLAVFNASQCSLQKKCATYPLEKIQKELTDDVLQKVFTGHRLVDFRYLLANPRKDVVKWALKHKDELNFRGIPPEFIEERQAVPELKELILKELGKKGE